MRGEFRVLGASPDGDSVRFAPDDPEAFAAARMRVRLNTAGAVQLRLDGIDALETHYTPPKGGMVTHQPLDLADAAADELLTILGFEEVVRDARRRVTEATPVTTRGWIATRFADRYGRAIAFAFGGEPPFAGTRRFITADHVAASANAHLLRTGLAYPTFYSLLFTDLRAELRAASETARTERLGVWDRDVTTSGFELTDQLHLADELVMMPKLFRRLAEYLAGADGVDLSYFEAFLAGHGDDVLVLPDGHRTWFGALLEVEGAWVRLTPDIADLVFFEE